LKGSLATAIAAGVLQFGIITGSALASTADGSTTFSVTITNVSKSDTLKIPGATGIRAPIAPGVFVVSKQATPIFTPGKPAGSAGLETLAEDGNFEPLQNALEAKFSGSAGMFVPGQSFTIVAKPGERLAFATMFVQSNDKFYGPKGGSLALFDAHGNPISGDLTAALRLYDAGTEMDQQPGTGIDQAPRQKAANQGAPQNGTVAEAHDGFAYPAVGDVIRIIVVPAN
jgi:hypothetical protein